MDFKLESKLNEENKCWNVSVYGEIDIFNSTEFKEYLLNLTKEKQLDLNLDCENLEYIDSTALGSLVSVLKTVRGYNGNITLRNTRPNIDKLFKITDLNKIFTIEGEKHE